MGKTGLGSPGRCRLDMANGLQARYRGEPLLREDLWLYQALFWFQQYDQRWPDGPGDGADGGRGDCLR